MKVHLLILLETLVLNSKMWGMIVIPNPCLDLPIPILQYTSHLYGPEIVRYSVAPINFPDIV